MTFSFLWPRSRKNPPPNDGPSAAMLIREGNDCLASGHLEDAAQHYERALAADSSGVDAYVNLGFVLTLLQRDSDAMQYLQRAIELMPQQHDAHYLLGLIAERQARLGDAISHLNAAVSTRVGFGAAWRDLCRLQLLAGQLEEALQAADHGLAAEPDSADLYIYKGSALMALQRLDDALACFDHAIAIQPDNAPAHSNRGLVLARLGRLDDALASHEQALRIDPDSSDAHFNRANVQTSLKCPTDALKSYDQAIRLNPQFADAYNNQGLAFEELGRIHEALASFDKAISIDPAHTNAHYNRGNALRTLNRLDDAVASYDKAISVMPNFANAHNNRGQVLHDLGRFQEAVASFEQAILLDPASPNAHFNESISHLLLGNFSIGWAEYEWRWARTDRDEDPRNYPLPRWSGTENLKGKTILIYAEQGLGDTIQFCRLVPQIAALGANVILEAQPALIPLLASLQGVRQLVGRGEALPAFDFHCPLLSLPLALEVDVESIPQAPYLKPSPDQVARWATTLGPVRRPRVGVVWSGSTGHKNDKNRSIAFREFQEILLSELEFVCLQKEIRPDDRKNLLSRPEVRLFDSALDDFDATAGLIEALDLVVTVDTSIAHLAGALGKDVWILLPYVPDWRWLLNRSDSPWYTSARLFRQHQTGDWADALLEIKSALRGRYLQ